jgi:hypothetical protein
VQRNERAPLPAAGVDVLEARAGLDVGRDQVEQLLERLDGLGEVAEALAPQPGDVAQDLRALGDGGVRRVCLLV